MASSGGGWGTFFKQELGRGYNFYLKIFLGGSVLKHYTFLKTTAPSPPPGNVINDRSLRADLLLVTTNVNTSNNRSYLHFSMSSPAKRF